MIGAKTGKGWVLPLLTVVDIYVVWILTSIVGLAITPIEGKLVQIFPGTTELMSQMILIGPNIAAIPFVFVGGMLATKFDTIKLINWSCALYLLAGVLFFVANSMWMIIILCFVCGIAAGALSPLSVLLITRIFVGKYKAKQLGFTSATLNVFLALAVILTGYLADINWRLPFAMYLLPIVPLILTKCLSKYLPEPVHDAKVKAAATGVKPEKLSFAKQCNIPALFRYCVFYLVISIVCSSVSQYIPFLFKSPKVAGNLTSILFVGIMLSGYMLNLLLRAFKSWTFYVIMAATAIGVFLILLTHEAWLVGVGIFIAAFFYGIGQPYCYDKVSDVATAAAASLAMAWLISMDSLANVITPFVVEGVAWVFGVDIHTNPEGPFKIMLVCTLIACALMAIYRFWRQIKGAYEHHEEEKRERRMAQPSSAHAAAKLAVAHDVYADNHQQPAGPAKSNPMPNPAPANA